MLKGGFFLLRSRWPLLISSYISRRCSSKGAFDLLFDGQKRDPASAPNTSGYDRHFTLE